MTDEILLVAADKMDKAIEFAKEEFAAIRTGRASGALFAKINADYYGSPTPLQQLASFSTPEPRTVIVTPFDKTAIAAIEKAIRDSDLGVSPANDGNVLRVVLPALTEERRRDYVKLAKAKAEDGRVAIRGVRRKAKEDIDKQVKDGEIGEDEGNRAEKELDALTKKYTDQIDGLLATKEQELLEV